MLLIDPNARDRVVIEGVTFVIRPLRGNEATAAAVARQAGDVAACMEIYLRYGLVDWHDPDGLGPYKPELATLLPALAQQELVARIQKLSTIEKAEPLLG